MRRRDLWLTFVAAFPLFGGVKKSKHTHIWLPITKVTTCFDYALVSPEDKILYGEIQSEPYFGLWRWGDNEWNVGIYKDICNKQYWKPVSFFTIQDKDLLIKPGEIGIDRKYASEILEGLKVVGEMKQMGGEV